MNSKFKLVKLWYAPPHYLSLLLLPLAWLFQSIVSLRVWLYRLGIKRSYPVSVPVIIVGNITVGGTGKTPFVIWLVSWLKNKGFRPGIITRGIGGKKQLNPYTVESSDTPELVGDEALLLRRKTQRPVVACVDKVKAAETLIQKHDCNMLICDDGLQHYRLRRQFEINVIDGIRRFGNRFLLPAGPLREPITRLKKVDFVVVNEGQSDDLWQMQLQPDAFISVQDPRRQLPLHAFANQEVHAIAGIGHPERFFNRLHQLKMQLKQHVFKDHHLFLPHELDFNDTLPVIMTEKDATKCTKFAQPHWWYLNVHVKLSAGFTEALWLALRNKGVV